MKNLNALDAFAVRRDMKKRIGFDEYCQIYSCSDDDLVYHIRRLFISDGDKIIKQMRKISAENKEDMLRRAKKSQKQSRKLLEKSSADGKATDTSEEGEDTSNPPPMEISASSSDPLAELREQEHSLSDQVIQLESEHKRLNGLHCGCLDQLRGIQKEIEAIREELQQKGAAYEQIVERNNQIVQNMNAISQQRSDLLSELCDVRQEIKAKTVIEVFVYTNGDIELVDATASVPLDDSGSEEIYSDLIGRDALQDLRIRDIRTLSRIVRIVSNSGLRIRPTFEDDSLEPFFQSLVPQPDPAA